MSHVRSIIVILLLLVPCVAHAGTDYHNPEHWSLEMRGGIQQPTGSAMKTFFGGCCSLTGILTGGVLIHSKLGFDAGIGFITDQTNTIGISTGRHSQEIFSFLMLPMILETTYRVDYHKDQPLAPFVKVGLDFIYFREGNQGVVVKGVKSGMHGGGGLMIHLNDLADGQLDTQYGLNDLFFIIDGRYNWVNDFGGSGLDLSSWAVTGGVHLQF